VAVFDALSIGQDNHAIAVQRLAARGKIDLDASIRLYVPELPSELDSITIQNCSTPRAAGGLPQRQERLRSR
jgi:CubicO group peptidase (beta-lactamase class C family)